MRQGVIIFLILLLNLVIDIPVAPLWHGKWLGRPKHPFTVALL